MLRKHVRKALCLPALAAAAILMLTGCGNPEAKEAFEAAAAALDEGRISEAEAGFAALIEEGEFLSESWRGTGIIQLLSEKPADACISFEKARLYAEDQSPDYLRDVDMYLAAARTEHGEAAKALAIYDEILAEAYDPETAFLRGSLLLKSGEAEKAAEDFSSIAAENVNSDLMIAISDLYRMNGYAAEADEYLEKIIAGGSSVDAARRGLAHYYLEEYPEAEADLRDAVAADPLDSDALILLGQALLAQERTEAARALFKEHSGDQSAASLCGLALCDMADGNYEDALARIEAGLALGDETAAQGLAYNEIAVLEYLGRWDEAKAKARAYAAAYPTDKAGILENAFLKTR
ncbi:MAG: tetratricopeptide repeat protein [Lachnospiraceae bacterium]|nr:tetratricopeptide repeat protein [Lachnospiraceae bacterium]